MGIPSLECFFLSPKIALLSVLWGGQHPGLYPPFGAHKFHGLFALKGPGPSLQPTHGEEPGPRGGIPRSHRPPFWAALPRPGPPLHSHLPAILTHIDIWGCW